MASRMTAEQAEAWRVVVQAGELDAIAFTGTASRCRQVAQNAVGVLMIMTTDPGEVRSAVVEGAWAEPVPGSRGPLSASLQ
jgi:hypothetical protein